MISSVTATCLQITYQQHPSGIATAVNFFWLLSLALSIACALWSQLASRWTVSAFHSSRAKWVSEWILTVPIINLSMSSLAFAWGLICLAFSVFPHTAIPIIMVIVTSVAALVCILVGTWLYMEHRITLHMSFGSPIKSWLKRHRSVTIDVEKSADPADGTIDSDKAKPSASQQLLEPLPDGAVPSSSIFFSIPGPTCLLDYYRYATQGALHCSVQRECLQYD